MPDQSVKPACQSGNTKAIGVDLTCAAKGLIAQDTPEGGSYVAPHLFADVAPTHALARDEIFGPVQVVIPFEDEAEAITSPECQALGVNQ